MYALERKGGYVLRKLQRGFIAMEAWCEHWKIKINKDKTQSIYFSHRRSPVGTHLTLKGRKIPFVKEVVVTWRQHIDSIITKALLIFIRVYPLLKSDRLSAKLKLTLYKTLMRSKMTYACPAWEFAADSHLLKLQRLQNGALRTTGNLPRRTLNGALHLAFKIPYVCDCIIRTHRKQAEVAQDQKNMQSFKCLNWCNKKILGTICRTIPRLTGLMCI